MRIQQASQYYWWKFYFWHLLWRVSTPTGHVMEQLYNDFTVSALFVGVSGKEPHVLNQGNTHALWEFWANYLNITDRLSAAIRADVGNEAPTALTDNSALLSLVRHSLSDITGGQNWLWIDWTLHNSSNFWMSLMYQAFRAWDELETAIEVSSVEHHIQNSIQFWRQKKSHLSSWRWKPY